MVDGTGKIFPIGSIPNMAGDPVYTQVTGGAAHVYQDGGAGVGQSYNREDTTATTSVESFTWSSGSRPTKIVVNLYNPSVVDQYMWVCFDAPDAATAAAWLLGAEGVAVDSQRFLVLPVDQGGVASNSPGAGGGKEFCFTAGLTNMYYKLSAGTGSIIVEAS